MIFVPMPDLGKYDNGRCKYASVAVMKNGEETFEFVPLSEKTNKPMPSHLRKLGLLAAQIPGKQATVKHNKERFEKWSNRVIDEQLKTELGGNSSGSDRVIEKLKTDLGEHIIEELGTGAAGSSSDRVIDSQTPRLPDNKERREKWSSGTAGSSSIGSADVGHGSTKDLILGF